MGHGPSRHRANLVKGVFGGLPVAEDPEQLALLAWMDYGELLEVCAVLRRGEAETVQEAVADLDTQDAACEEAYRRRAGFCVIDGGLGEDLEEL